MLRSWSGRATTLAWAAVAALVPPAALLAPADAAVGPARAVGPAAPNVVVVVLDDARADDLQFLPQTRRLVADAGATFAHYYSSHSLCCPQRATYLRGQFTHNHGVLDLEPPDGGWERFRPLEESTLATWLDDAGYRTGLFGKYLNGYPAGGTVVPQGWDDWHATGPVDHQDLVVSDDGAPQRWKGYQADYVAERAVEFVRASSAADEPWFAYLNPVAPHLPYTPAFRHADAPVVVPPAPPSFNEADVRDKPSWVRSLPLLDPSSWATTQLRRGRMLLAVDELVARVVQAVADEGELSTTLFMITSDNGFSLGEHRRLGKRSAYEESLRLPLLVRGPGVPAGLQPQQLASGVDLAPTVADYAGVPAPAYVDGRSLRPLLESTATTWRRFVFAEHVAEQAAMPAPTLTAVRGAARKVVEYPATSEVEAYDLRYDPHELTSRPGAPWVAGLRERLRAFEGCAADTCRAAEDGTAPAG